MAVKKKTAAKGKVIKKAKEEQLAETSENKINPPSNAREITIWKNAGLEERFRLIAEKPANKTWRDYAPELGITEPYIHEFRAKHADQINEIAIAGARREFAPIVKAVSARAQDPDERQAWKYAELVFDRFGWQKPEKDDFRFYPFNNFWPQLFQTGFIFHRDLSFGDKGNDQIIGFVGGQGTGKTLMGAKKSQLMARENIGVNGLVTAPSYRRLHDVSMPAFETFLEWDGIPYKRRDSDKEYILWPNTGFDTHVLFRSMDDSDSIRGIEVAWCWPDEIRDMDSYAVSVMLGRVRHPKARFRQIFATTTPNGFDHVYDLFKNPHSETVKTRTSFQYHATSYENIFLPRSIITTWETQYDELMFKQEVLGEYVNFGGGRVYYAFDFNTNIKPTKFDPSLPVWIGQDFNVNPMASVLCQPKRNGAVTEVHVFDEITARSANVQDTIKALREKGFDPKTYRGELTLYPDATGWNNNAAAERSSLTQLKDAGFNIQSPKANPLIRDRYAAVNGKLRNANGVATLFIDPKCKSLIHDLEREVYQEGAPIREKTKDGANTRGHHSDALGYIIHREFAIESGFRPARIS